jgi:hypothetical protein
MDGELEDWILIVLPFFLGPQPEAQALIDLENNVPELKAELRVLQISAAREVDVRGGKKAIVVFVPVPQLKAFRKVQQRYVRTFDYQQKHPEC